MTAFAVKVTWRRTTPQCRPHPAWCPPPLEQTGKNSKQAIRSCSLEDSEKENATGLVGQGQLPWENADPTQRPSQVRCHSLWPYKQAATKLQKLLSRLPKLVPSHQIQLYYHLLCTNASAPVMYGLPTVHKPGIPLCLLSTWPNHCSTD